MRSRCLLIAMACVMGLLASCGGDSMEPAGCADLADRYAAATREIIELIGERTDAEMESPSQDLQDAADEWFATMSDVIPRIADLCGEDEFDELLCEGKSQIEPRGEAGRRFLDENYPACSD